MLKEDIKQACTISLDRCPWQCYLYIWIIEWLIQKYQPEEFAVFEQLLCQLLCPYVMHETMLNSLRPRQNRRHFADDIFKCIFFNEDIRISMTISLKFIAKGPIDNIPALVQIMAWRRPGDKPLSEPMMLSSLTHICVTRPQWVKSFKHRLRMYTYSCWHVHFIQTCIIVECLFWMFYLK